jgi:hypothetical protein
VFWQSANAEKQGIQGVVSGTCRCVCPRTANPGHGTSAKDPQRPADEAAGLGSGPAVRSGARRRPTGEAVGSEPSYDPAGRSGADTGAGSQASEDLAGINSGFAAGGLGARGQAGSASPGRNRTRTAVFGGPLDPALGGAERPVPQADESGEKADRARKPQGRR